MNVREKLVELIVWIEDQMTRAYPYTTDQFRIETTVDHLISHGVTVQGWISVEEHLPQENEPEGAICEQVQVLLDNGVVSTGWCNRRTKLWWHLNYGETDFTGCDYEHTPVIAWQPLAQPPKGE